MVALQDFQGLFGIQSLANKFQVQQIVFKSSLNTEIRCWHDLEPAEGSRSFNVAKSFEGGDDFLKQIIGVGRGAL